MSRSCAARLVLAASVLAAFAATRATAGVDAEVPLALTAKGTLLPEGEIETYRFNATNGTLLTFQAVAGKGARLAFSAHLFDSAGTEVVIPAGFLVVTAKKLSVKKLPLTKTGAYRLEISATGTGEYSLTLSGKARPTFGGTLTLGAAGTANVAFSAPPGSGVTLSAKAARASPATPRFGALTGVGVNLDLSTMKTIKPTSHTVVLASVGGTGDLSVDVNNPGAAGDVTVAIAIRAPKVKTLKLDTRGAARGHPLGGESVMSRTVGPIGGTVEITDGWSDINGAKVVIPPGAFDRATTVTVASAPPLKTDAGDQAAGPPVFLGPSGVTFAAPVAVVLPYDPASIPVGQTETDLRVLVVETNGSSAILQPKSFDNVGRTVTVEANGFSTCVPIVRLGQQPLGLRAGGDEFWLLVLDGSLEPSVSQDSRSRNFSLEIGEASFQSAGVFQVSGSERSFSFDNLTDVIGNQLNGNLVVTAQPDNLLTTWSYGTDGQSVVVQGDAGPISFATSSDGNYLAARGGAVTDPRAGALLLVRKNKSAVTASSLAGTYHMMFWDVSADNQGGNAGVQPRSSRLVGTFVFDAAGGFRISGSQRDSELTAAGNATSVVSPVSVSGTYVIEASGAVVATIAPSDGDPEQVFRLYPGPDGAVLIGTEKDPPSKADLPAMVLVRHGTGLGAGVASGAYRGTEVDLELVPYTVPKADLSAPFVIADFQVFDERIELTFAGAGSLTVLENRHRVQRDPSAAGGVKVGEETKPEFTVKYRIDKSGKFTIVASGGGAPVGAITPDGMFGCGVSDVGVDDPAATLLFFVKLPPPK